MHPELLKVRDPDSGRIYPIPAGGSTALLDKPKSGDGEKPEREQEFAPFVQGARERTELFHDKSTQLQDAATRQVGRIDLPPNGFLAHVLLLVEATGGDGSTTPAVAHEDAPWNVFQEVEFIDTANNTLVKLDGYSLFLANKWGAYSFLTDPRQSPSFSAPDGDGDFSFILRIPVQVAGRDALGSLSNQDSSHKYGLRYVINQGQSIYTTSPEDAGGVVLPEVRVRAIAEFWSVPRGQDLFGRPFRERPPAHGTLQFWQKAGPVNVESGDQRVEIDRVGHHWRTLVLVCRTAADARSDSIFPDPIELRYDGNEIDDVPRAVLRHRMVERYGFNGALDSEGGPDTGVFVYEWSHDLDYKPGNELRDFYLPTTGATNIELRGNFGAAAKIDVIVNDVASDVPIFSA